MEKKSNNAINFMPDGAEIHFNSVQQLKDFLAAMDKESVWLTVEDGVSAGNIRFEGLPDPLTAVSEISRLRKENPELSEEAVMDTLHSEAEGYFGTSQVAIIKGKPYPIGASAIPGICARAGLLPAGFEKLRDYNPDVLAEVLNDCGDADKGDDRRAKRTVLVRFGKVRAVNSGRYAICPEEFVFDTAQKWVADERPAATFISGYANHDVLLWKIDLSAYSNEVVGPFQALMVSGFTPALVVQCSSTAASSVMLKPALQRNGVMFPIGEPIAAPHIGKGDTAERTEQIKAAVRENFKKIFPSMTKAAEAVEKLDSIVINNAISAVTSVMRDLKVPKAQGIEALEQFKQIFPEQASAYDCLGCLFDAYSFVVRDFPGNERKHLEMAEICKRASVLKWTERDYPGAIW